MKKVQCCWKRANIMAILIVGMLVSFFTLSGSVMAQMKGPKDFSMTNTGDAAQVTFSHQQHSDSQNLKCRDCHTKIFQMKVGKTADKQGPLTMAAMQEGKFCGACHNGDKAFGVQAEDTCAKCHVQP